MSKNHSAADSDVAPRELEKVPATFLRVKTRDLIEGVKFGGKRFLIENFGRPMVVLISYEDYLRIRNLLPYPGAEHPTLSAAPRDLPRPDGDSSSAVSGLSIEPPGE